MAKNARNNRKSPPFAWKAMFIGITVGVLITLLICLNDKIADFDFVGNGLIANKKIAKKEAKAEPLFEFYTLLPETETVVNHSEDNKTPVVAIPSQQQKTKKTEKKISYILQTGSFKKLTDADSLKARLAFLGITSKIQKVTIDNKDTWHRVQIGPIVGRQQVDILQKQLQQNKIEFLLMRAKHS